MTLVEIVVPDGVAAGDDFVIEFEGLNLSVQCPDGCQAGDAINIEVDAPAGGGAAPNQVEVVIPDGCYPGSAFTVEFNSQSFDITVPDGCEPGQALLVDVPDSGGADDTAAGGPSAADRDAALSQQAQNENPGSWSCDACTYLNEPHRKVCEMCGTARENNGGTGGGASSSSYDQEESDANLAKMLQGEEPSSLFAMSVGTDDGTFGKKAGDFHVGQLVQVTRSDGSWTYGKVMAYDEGGDNYSVMTKAGPKHFVERADLTDDVVVNPSDGSCAQQ